jgi:hypothetical protein
MERIFFEIVDTGLMKDFRGPAAVYAFRRWKAGDVNRFLYQVGFDQNFIQKCEFSYGWNFSAIIRSLEDGSFVAADEFAPTETDGNVGQHHLVGLALVCSGMVTSNLIYRDSAVLLSQALKRDGWVYEGGTLQRIDSQIIDKPTERKVIERLI